MTGLSTLVRGSLAAILARHGRPVVLARRTGTFDPATQATGPGSVACTVPALVLRRGGRDAEIQVHLADASLAAAGYPGAPRPGDILSIDGEDWPVTVVESFGAGESAGLHRLRVVR